MKSFITYLFYRLHLESPITYRKNAYKWKFYFIPRKFPLILLGIILSPIILIKKGFKGLKFWFVEIINKKHHNVFILHKNIPKPSKWDCYNKFLF